MAKRNTNSKLTFKTTSEIEGVIASCGGSSGSRPVLVLILRPWRQLGGSIQRKELRIEVPVKSDAVIDRAMDKWSDGAVATTVRTTHKATKLYLEKIVAQSPLRRVELSAELKRVSDEQSRPKVLTSPVLGRLKLDRDASWFEATRTFKRNRYNVMVETMDPDNAGVVAKEILRAEKIVPNIEQTLPQLRTSIAADLLDTYNDSWRESGRSLSAADFARRHKLSSVQVGKNRITLHFENGGLFTEHCVELRLSPRLKVQEILVA